MTPVLLAGKSQVELLLLIITFSLREGRVIQHLLSDAHDKADNSFHLLSSSCPPWRELHCFFFFSSYESRWPSASGCRSASCNKEDGGAGQGHLSENSVSYFNIPFWFRLLYGLIVYFPNSLFLFFFKQKLSWLIQCLDLNCALSIILLHRCISHVQIITTFHSYHIFNVIRS